MSARRSFSVKEKVEIISKLKNGGNNADLCREYKISHSTISSMWKNRDKILKCFESKSSKIKRNRNPMHQDVENALLMWLKAQRSQNIPLSSSLLQEKANHFARLFGKKEFLCSQSWIYRFRQRNNIAVGKVCEEATVSISQSDCDKRIKKELTEDYTDSQIWNADETGLNMGDSKEEVACGPWSVEGVEVAEVKEVCAAGWDALIVVLSPGVTPPQAIEDFVADLRLIDKGIDERCAVVRCERVSGARLVLAPTGPLTPYDDVRSVSEAAYAGVKRALEAGARRPVLALQPHPRFPRAPLVALLAALEAAYCPLQSRESFPHLVQRPEALGVYGEGEGEGEGLHPLAPTIACAVALETARCLARDVGGGDPERMSPLQAACHLQQAFQGSRCRVRVETDAQHIRDHYPLLAAVSRAADQVPRHRGCIVFLEYEPEQYEKTLMFVGKGVTYDTGGADVKINGAMAGMSRDKCGAATVAGFLKACELLRPELKVVAALGFARNSIGADSYVADELLRARCGRVVRVGNTDAEGRMVMADLLYQMRVQASQERSPHLYTVATLTGHAHRAYGPGYTAVVDSHVAHAQRHASRLRRAGEQLGDMLEVSRVRREDLRAHRACAATGAELLQALPQPSAATPRGHQGPAAFLLQVAKLDEEDAPPFTHLDIAASAGDHPHHPVPATLLALAAHYGLIAC
ncbi:hypothetical protein evm_002950 [Chilo suppressalis]|nr:hypothetical protein evm_002950 [Chilo suppressalis]